MDHGQIGATLIIGDSDDLQFDSAIIKPMYSS
jgi:hypothetical protein